MKCLKCANVATFHITDIERGKLHEYHFCDDHARQHLAPADITDIELREHRGFSADPSDEPTTSDLDEIERYVEMIWRTHVEDDDS